jgi:hypothetical protein
MQSTPDAEKSQPFKWDTKLIAAHLTGGKLSSMHVCDIGVTRPSLYAKTTSWYPSQSIPHAKDNDTSEIAAVHPHTKELLSLGSGSLATTVHPHTQETPLSARMIIASLQSTPVPMVKMLTTLISICNFQSTPARREKLE